MKTKQQLLNTPEAHLGDPTVQLEILIDIRDALLRIDTTLQNCEFSEGNY